MPSPRPAAWVLLVALAGPGLAGCAGSPGTEGEDSAAPATAASSPASSLPASVPGSLPASVPGSVPRSVPGSPPGPRPPGSARPPGLPTDPSADQVLTLTGTISLGPVPGCVVLRGPDGAWSLVGERAGGLTAGRRVSVTGYPLPHVRSACGAAAVRVVGVRPG